MQNQIMNLYLYEDIFYRFRAFFNVKTEDSHICQDLMLDADSRFLYDICFGLMPRRFDPTDEDRIIFEEEDVVSELYLILDGVVGIGYNLLGPVNPLTGARSQYQIAKKLKR